MQENFPIYTQSIDHKKLLITVYIYNLQKPSNETLVHQLMLRGHKCYGLAPDAESLFSLSRVQPICQHHGCRKIPLFFFPELTEGIWKSAQTFPDQIKYINFQVSFDSPACPCPFEVLSTLDNLSLIWYMDFNIVSRVSLANWNLTSVSPEVG